MNNKKLHSALAGAALLSLAGGAHAGFFDLTLEPYVVASVGQASADTSDRYCDQPVRNAVPAGSVGSFSCDDQAIAGRVGVGLEVNEYISMEAGYIQIDEFEGRNAAGDTASVDFNGMTVAVVGTLRTSEQFMFIARGGFGILHTDVKSNRPVGPVPASPTSVEETDLEWMFGLGAQYNLNKAIGLRFEWERYFNVGDPDTTDESDIDVVTLGVQWKF